MIINDNNDNDNKHITENYNNAKKNTTCVYIYIIYLCRIL